MKRVALHHDENRRFKKGNPGGGRKLGVPNKVTTTLKEALLEAAAMVGADGEGLLALHGYLCRLALNEPKSFARLLEKLIPLQVTGSVEFTNRKYETMADLAAVLRERGLPPPHKLIDVTPTPGAKEHARKNGASD